MTTISTSLSTSKSDGSSGISDLNAQDAFSPSEHDESALSTWQFDPVRRVLTFYKQPGWWVYEVDLDRCSTSAQVLDWIFQITQKRWATDHVLAALRHALNAMLRPQATLCGSGCERGPIGVPSTLQRLAEGFKGTTK